MTDVALDEIVIDERDREEFGNIEELADSIKTVGLLHPVVVTAGFQLVAGDRRLAAVRHLGWDRVPVTIVDLTNAADVLKAEFDENTCRKPLTPWEASRARERRSRILAEDAKRRQTEAIKVRDEKGRAVSTSSNLDEVEDRPLTPAEAADMRADREAQLRAERAARATRKIAAAGTGYSGSTLDKVDKIRDVAERGVIRRGKEEIPAPAPVREVAQQALEGVKKSGAAVESASKQVNLAIEKYIEDDESVKRARYRAALTKAIASVSSGFLTFDPAMAAQSLDDLAGIEAVRFALNDWFTKFDTACAPGEVIQLRRRSN